MAGPLDGVRIVELGVWVAGPAAAAAVAAALFSQERTGRGQLCSTSLFRTGIYTISFDLSATVGWGLTPAVGSRDTMHSPTTNDYVAADGRRFWVVGLEADRHWPAPARAVGRPEWIGDERFATAADRARNSPELIGELDKISVTRTPAQWEEIFATEPEFFWAPVQSPDDLLADPQFHASGALVAVPEGSVTTSMIATPVDFDGTPWAPRSPAPRLGEQTREILEGLGRADDAESLAARGVVGVA